MNQVHLLSFKLLRPKRSINDYKQENHRFESFVLLKVKIYLELINILHNNIDGK